MDQTVFPESQKAAGLHLWKKMNTTLQQIVTKDVF